MNGYFISIGKKCIFLNAKNDRKNPSTVKAMIKAICKYHGGYFGGTYDLDEIAIY